MSAQNQPLPDRETLLDLLAGVNVALCQNPNNQRHYQAVNALCKVAEVITSDEFGGITREDDGSFTVLERRRCMGGVSVLTTNRPTALEALVAAYDEQVQAARRR